jgi:low temperature requirement protein LtrA
MSIFGNRGKERRKMSDQKMFSIWFFVGLMLTVLGIIITAPGINYVFNPQDRTALHELNPNLWWGVLMFLAGLTFLIPAWAQHRSN